MRVIFISAAIVLFSLSVYSQPDCPYQRAAEEAEKTKAIQTNATRFENPSKKRSTRPIVFRNR